jgi:hypothetical protein
MATQLTKPVSRVTSKTINGRAVVLTIAPLGSQSEARIGVRLSGKRTQYVVTLSDLYRISALWYSQRYAAAKKEARKNQIPWRIAKKKFDSENKI